MAYQFTKAFMAKLDRLDLSGLEDFRADRVGRAELARFKFSKTRSVKDGDTFTKYRHELSAINNRIHVLKAKKDNA